MVENKAYNRGDNFKTSEELADIDEELPEDGHSSANCRQYRIAVMLSDPLQQYRLVIELRRLLPDAKICIFSAKEKLFKEAERHLFPITFLSDHYGTESGIAIGKHVQELGQERCNLIYVVNTTNYVTMRSLWDMHVSGILRQRFSNRDIRAELENLRYPVEYEM